MDENRTRLTMQNKGKHVYLTLSYSILFHLVPSYSIFFIPDSLLNN